MKYIFETERLRARRFEPGDAKGLYAIHRDEEVIKWIPDESYEDMAEAEEAAVFFAECTDKGELPYVLAAELKETGELIGDTGINEVEGRPEEVEIGFVICGEQRGKGYAAELLAAMTEYAFSAFGINALYGRVMKGNDASARVLEKCGYSLIKEEYGAEDDPYGNSMLIYLKKR